MLENSVADPGRLPRIHIFSIPDLIFFHPGFVLKNSSILTQKIVTKLSEIWSGLFIPDPDPDFLPIPNPRSRGKKATGTRIRNTAWKASWEQKADRLSDRFKKKFMKFFI